MRPVRKERPDVRALARLIIDLAAQRCRVARDRTPSPCLEEVGWRAGTARKAIGVNELVWYQLRFPGSLDVQSAVGFVRSLAARGRAGWISPTRPLVFELQADRHGVAFLVGLPESEAGRLKRSMETWLPGLAVELAVVRHGETELANLAVELRLRFAAPAIAQRVAA